jgi:Fe-S-cluster containining protein
VLSPESLRRTIAEETERVAALLKQRALDNVLEAITSASEAADALNAEYDALEPPQFACKKGCSWCCHQRVSVNVPELIRIVAYLRAKLDPAQFMELGDRIRATASRTRGLSREERFHPSYPCPLLSDGACLVHEVRPMVCRGANSFDARACERVLNDETARRDFVYGGATPIPGLSRHMMIIQAFLAGLTQGLSRAGLPAYPLELNAALRAILDRPASVDRWLSGLHAFAQSRNDGDDAPLWIQKLRQQIS